MNFASIYTFLSHRMPPPPPNLHHPLIPQPQDLNLNVFVVTFQGVKAAEQQLAGGDPYYCKECRSILNTFSKILWSHEAEQLGMKIQLGANEAFWKCQFCSFENMIQIQKEEIPLKEDIVYMLQSCHNNQTTQNDSTLVFCIDISGSMNSTTEIQGKIGLKYGISQEELEMLRQFMQPGDQAQINFFPGQHNQNKTYISRKQCILSAIESQLNEIKKTDPFKKIGFVFFNSEVIAIGDSKSQTVSIVGDKLYNKESIVNSLEHFKLSDHLVDSFDNLINKINKVQATGQTALGPALITALNIAAKGKLGSSVILCTDGLANIGIGQLQPYDEEKKKYYGQLGQWSKERNVSVNIITIKGQGCKMQAIGQLAQLTNGNIKVVNPDKLSDDFANVLKDEVVGLNVLVKVILHKAMTFRNQQNDKLKDQGTILQKQIANATKNTRISFQYQIKGEEQLMNSKINLQNLKKIPFQAQIQYTSTTGIKYLRVISAECDTTTEKQKMIKQANLGVVHQRITSQTAALYKAGDFKGSYQFNNRWAGYLDQNFKEEKFQEHQNKFVQKNERLNKAIRHRHKKSVQKKSKNNDCLSQGEMQILNNNSEIDSDSDQNVFVDNLMERQNYSINKKSSFNSGSDSDQEVGKKSNKKRRSKGKQMEGVKRQVSSSLKKERKPSVKRERKPSIKRERQRSKSRSIQKKKRPFKSREKKRKASFYESDSD